jgi:hypothetical protein
MKKLNLLFIMIILLSLYAVNAENFPKEDNLKSKEDACKNTFLRYECDKDLSVSYEIRQNTDCNEYIAKTEKCITPKDTTFEKCEIDKNGYVRVIEQISREYIPSCNSGRCVSKYMDKSEIYEAGKLGFCTLSKKCTDIKERCQYEQAYCEYQEDCSPELACILDDKNTDLKEHKQLGGCCYGTQKWDLDKQKCYCPDGTVFNEKTKICEGKEEKENCDDGQYFDEKLQTCRCKENIKYTCENNDKIISTLHPDCSTTIKTVECIKPEDIVSYTCDANSIIETTTRFTNNCALGECIASSTKSITNTIYEGDPNFCKLRKEKCGISCTSDQFPCESDNQCNDDLTCTKKDTKSRSGGCCLVGEIWDENKNECVFEGGTSSHSICSDEQIAIERTELKQRCSADGASRECSEYQEKETETFNMGDRAYCLAKGILCGTKCTRGEYSCTRDNDCQKDLVCKIDKSETGGCCNIDETWDEVKKECIKPMEKSSQTCKSTDDNCNTFDKTNTNTFDSIKSSVIKFFTKDNIVVSHIFGRKDKNWEVDLVSPAGGYKTEVIAHNDENIKENTATNSAR